jgi:hypothetical protein
VQTPRLAAALGVAAGVIGAAACGAANVRPYITPFPGAPRDTVRGDPAVIVPHLVRLLTAESIAVRIASPEEGYIESRWRDLRELGVTGPFSYGPEVRYRFWVDPVGQGRTQVIGEVAGRRTVDPSLPERLREVLLPAEHPGREILQRIMAAVRERYQ